MLLRKTKKGKKYTKNHILQMLLIYSLKNTISIQEIKKILQPFHDHMEEIEPIYNNYLNIQKELSHDVTVSIQNLIKNQFY